MSYRISPVWWPAIGLSSPILLPLLFSKNRRFNKSSAEAVNLNTRRLESARPVNLPPLEYFELIPLVEQKVEDGFLGAPGVSYHIRTSLGSLLFDVGFGPENPALAHNAKRLGFTTEGLDGFVISHLHPDHMGGMKAMRQDRVTIPVEIGRADDIPCFLPAEAATSQAKAKLIKEPEVLTAGVASTGPLARALFFMGWTEEQAIVAHVKNKGLVIFTGCGHPTIEVIINMVRRMSQEPIYAIGGGLHFPLTDSPYSRLGIKMQMIFGTGKPPWRPITENDLSRSIAFINEIGPKFVLLSAHDTCDYAINRFATELKTTVSILRAGASYRL